MASLDASNFWMICHFRKRHLKALSTLFVHDFSPRTRQLKLAESRRHHETAIIGRAGGR
jgi:hypothetical protein